MFTNGSPEEGTDYLNDTEKASREFENIVNEQNLCTSFIISKRQIPPEGITAAEWMDPSCTKYEDSLYKREKAIFSYLSQLDDQDLKEFLTELEKHYIFQPFLDLLLKIIAQTLSPEKAMDKLHGHDLEEIIEILLTILESTDNLPQKILEMDEGELDSKSVLHCCIAQLRSRLLMLSQFLDPGELIAEAHADIKFEVCRYMVSIGMSVPSELLFQLSPKRRARLKTIKVAVTDFPVVPSTFKVYREIQGEISDLIARNVPTQIIQQRLKVQWTDHYKEIEAVLRTRNISSRLFIQKLLSEDPILDQLPALILGDTSLLEKPA